MSRPRESDAMSGLNREAGIPNSGSCHIHLFERDYEA